jgi:hypothetical protein
MVSKICYTNSTRTLEHSYFISSQLLRQGNSSITIFQSTDDVLSGSFYRVCTHRTFKTYATKYLYGSVTMLNLDCDCGVWFSNTHENEIMRK